jgi:hypothetical protein
VDVLGALSRKNPAEDTVLVIVPSVHVSRPMTADRTAIWSVLADFPNIAAWNSGVKTSYSTSEAAVGVGAMRHCDLAPIGTLEESIAEWVEGERLVIDIDSATKLPIESAVATFTIGEDATDVEYEYVPKGRLGSLVAPLLSRQLTKGFDGFLADLDAAAQALASG